MAQSQKPWNPVVAAITQPLRTVGANLYMAGRALGPRGAAENAGWAILKRRWDERAVADQMAAKIPLRLQPEAPTVIDLRDQEAASAAERPIQIDV